MHPLNQNPILLKQSEGNKAKFSIDAPEKTDLIWAVARSYLFTRSSSELSLEGRVKAN